MLLKRSVISWNLGIRITFLEYNFILSPETIKIIDFVSD